MTLEPENKECLKYITDFTTNMTNISNIFFLLKKAVTIQNYLKIFGHFFLIQSLLLHGSALISLYLFQSEFLSKFFFFLFLSTSVFFLFQFFQLLKKQDTLFQKALATIDEKNHFQGTLLSSREFLQNQQKNS